MCTVGLVLWIVYGCIYLSLSLREVCYDKLHRIDDGTYTQSTFVQIIADGRLKERHLVECVKLRIANLVDERENAFWAIATAAETTYGRHAWVVPAVYYSFLNQYKQVAL